MEFVHVVVAGAVGVVGVVVPLLLLWLSVRFMRNPTDSAVTSRKSIGLTAMVVSVCGLVAISADLPAPPQWDAVHSAGGLVGVVAHAVPQGLVLQYLLAERLAVEHESASFGHGLSLPFAHGEHVADVPSADVAPHLWDAFDGQE